MLVSPQILVWSQDQRSLRILKLQWHRARLGERWVLVWVSVVESADFVFVVGVLGCIPLVASVIDAGGNAILTQFSFNPK